MASPDYTQMPFEELEALMESRNFDIVPSGPEMGVPEESAALLPEQSPEVSAQLGLGDRQRQAIRSRLRNRQSFENSKSETI